MDAHYTHYVYRLYLFVFQIKWRFGKSVKLPIVRVRKDYYVNNKHMTRYFYSYNLVTNAIIVQGAIVHAVQLSCTFTCNTHTCSAVCARVRRCL